MGRLVIKDEQGRVTGYLEVESDPSEIETTSTTLPSGKGGVHSFLSALFGLIGLGSIALGVYSCSRDSNGGCFSSILLFLVAGIGLSIFDENSNLSLGVATRKTLLGYSTIPLLLGALYFGIQASGLGCGIAILLLAAGAYVSFVAEAMK